MKQINLRSDTVTVPTAAMREAITRAEVGDDYYRTDPTVRKLEERAAEMLGKESALLVLSGTMGNLVSLLSLTGRGQTVIVGDQAHILLNEAGNISAVGGVTLHAVPTDRGMMDLVALEQRFLPHGSILFAPTSVVCIENTHVLSGGRCLSNEQVDAICDTAARNGVRVHMDGARIFNAAVALGTPVADLVRKVDTITFCLSKGLGCPVGSIIAADADLIEEARHWRQMVGGGMRQAGIFAAAGLVALDTMIDRLAEDHQNACLLALRLTERGVPLEPEEVETNMVFLPLSAVRDSQSEFVSELAAHGVIVNAARNNRVRFVTHCGITSADIDAAAPIIARAYDRFRQRTTGHIAQLEGVSTS